MATFLSSEERRLAQAIASVGFANPFLPERIASEREALGRDFTPADAVWNVRTERVVQNPNIARLGERATVLAKALRERLAAGSTPRDEDRKLYEDVVLYALYTQHEGALWALMTASGAGRIDAAGLWPRFRDDVEHWLGPLGATRAPELEAPHVLACLFQVRRAFHHIFWSIIGGSMPAARLRAGVWQSIFTHDMRRYRRALWSRMDDVTTLVAGPSGTGKEVVARAVALSRYVPFDARTGRFAADFAGLFHPLNLSALAPTLVESELFGHRRGAFTGALQDRAGWLETCEPFGTVFLDEIGDVDAGIQVKLLRVLQTRTFERMGDTKALHFRGKIIAATNRDLGREIAAGRFREDFYYRLCADIIHTPALAEQLVAEGEELPNLVLFIARRLVGDEEAPPLAEETLAWIDRSLGRKYAWPGNVRELEQCVRNVLIRGEYRPARVPRGGARDELAAAILAGRLSAEELLGRYCTLVFAETRSYQETARRLGIDRRTVRRRVDPELLRALDSGDGERRPADRRLQERTE
jgi:hypothetical protein